MGLASVSQLVGSISLVGHHRAWWNMPQVVLNDHTGRKQGLSKNFHW